MSGLTYTSASKPPKCPDADIYSLVGFRGSYKNVVRTSSFSTEAFAIALFAHASTATIFGKKFYQILILTCTHPHLKRVTSIAPTRWWVQATEMVVSIPCQIHAEFDHFRRTQCNLSYVNDRPSLKMTLFQQITLPGQQTNLATWTPHVAFTLLKSSIQR
jgi:hypothetical protein